jgi:hypothetical protein
MEWLKSFFLEEMMRKLVLVCTVLLSVTAVNAMAERWETIDARNEYGGKTYRGIFSGDDPQYRDDGIDKIVSYLDSRDVMRKMETYYSQSKAYEEGIYRGVIYYNEEGKRIRQDFYHTASHAAKTGAHKGTIYYENGEKKRTVLFDESGNVLTDIRY